MFCSKARVDFLPAFCVESRDFLTRRGPATRGAMRFGVRDWRRPSLASEVVSSVATAGAASARPLHLGGIGPHFSLGGTDHARDSLPDVARQLVHHRDEGL